MEELNKNVQVGSGNDYFSTENLFQAAFCWSKGLEPMGKELRGPHSTKFIVHFKGENAKVVAAEYYSTDPNSDGFKARRLSDCYRTAREYTHNAEYYRQRYA